MLHLLRIPCIFSDARRNRNAHPLLANNYHTETKNANREGIQVAIFAILTVRGGSVQTKADRVVLLAVIFPSWAESHQNYQLIEVGSKRGGDMDFSVYVRQQEYRITLCTP
jgi:hypothetical protein